MSDRRVLVCVDATEKLAEGMEFLRSLPEEWRNRPDVHYLLLCDPSIPAALQTAKESLHDLGFGYSLILPLKEVRGLGACSKLALRLGLDRGYDAIAMLPANSPTSALLDLVRGWDETEADVIVRQTEDAASSKLMMVLLNTLTGLDLTDYFSPQRLFTTNLVQQIPFELNADDDLFLLEILLQAAYVNARIACCEPTSSPGARSHKPGCVKISRRRILAAALRYRLHHWGMFCSLKLRRLGVERYRDKTNFPYTTHTMAVDEVRRRGLRRVLDIGCGPGYVAAACIRNGVEVTGIDACEPPSVPLAAYYRIDLERDALPCSPADYDATLLLDVIEHLSYPEQFLLALRNAVGSRSVGDSSVYPLLILSTPNVAFFSVRMSLLWGRFNYAERGILDVTHKRLFTRSSLLRMLRECGCEVESIQAVGAPFAAVMTGRSGRILGWLAHVLAQMCPSLFAFQFFVICRLRPGIHHLLQQAVVIQPTQIAKKLTERAL